MKNRSLLIFTIVPLVLGGCSNGDRGKGPSELVDKDVEVTMASQFTDGNYVDTCHYSDSWFLEDSHTENYKLALMSAMADGASSSNELDNNGTKINNLLESIGYTNIQKNDYYAQGLTLDNSLGAIIGKKDIQDKSGKKYTLLAVFPRSAGYGNEWAGNFNMGTAGMHKGFQLARDEMLRFTKQYITANNITGNLKIWSAGYSRGAAAVNLYGGYLADNSAYLGNKISLSSNDLYVYTIASPRNLPTGVTKADALSVSGPRSGNEFRDTNVPAYTYAGESGTINPSADQYKGIHNYVAVGDYVTKLPPEEWSFTRYGVTEEVTYGSSEMLRYLEQISPDTAAKFANGKTYATPVPTKEFDFDTFEIVDGEDEISADAMIEERLNALMGIAANREQFVNEGYNDILGGATGIFGTDWNGFYDGVMSNKTGIAKVAALSYLAYAVKALNMEDTEGVTYLIMNVMEVLGKPIADRANYTDQDFLQDIFDLLINDYQTSEQARTRASNIADLLPTPYSTVYINFLDYAKNNHYTVTCFDGLISLLANYIHENKTNEAVDALVSNLSAMIPNEYTSYFIIATGKSYNVEDYESVEAMKKAAVLDAFDCCVLGQFDEDGVQTSTPEAVRYAILAAVYLYLSWSKNASNLGNLLVNGAINNGEVYHSEPIPLSTLIGEILVAFSDKDEDGHALSLEKGADKAIIDLLNSGRTPLNYKHVDTLKNNPAGIRKVLVTMLFNPGAEFDFEQDVANAVTFVDMVSFLYPAHYSEMYICYLKTKI